MASYDHYAQTVRDALAARTPLCIQGSGSKHFLGRPVRAQHFALSGNCGVVNYQPTELIITVRGGTTLNEVEETLAAKNQMLPFEPPHFGPAATIAGAICSGLSGPRRPHAGAGRDALLGVRIIDGRGRLLRFGGEVMKNVAGYDISRLMCGAFGTLGVVLELSIKVSPCPLVTQTRTLDLSQTQFLQRMSELGATPAPISASCHDGERMYLRLAGTQKGVASAGAKIGGELLANDTQFWLALREQTLAFFDTAADSRALWRLSVPPAAAPTSDHECLYEWGGAQRWVRTDLDAQAIRHVASQLGGHATCFRPASQAADSERPTTCSPFAPLGPGLLAIHRRLKQSFDPEGILNPGRMYAEI